LRAIAGASSVNVGSSRLREVEFNAGPDEWSTIIDLTPVEGYLLYTNIYQEGFP